LQELARRVGVPRGLAELGVRDEDVPVLAHNAMADACITTNPRPADEAALRALFRAAL
jgi:1,3-propanediol dehydrogenase